MPDRATWVEGRGVRGRYYVARAQGEGGTRLALPRGWRRDCHPFTCFVPICFRNPERLDFLYRRNEPVSAARQRFDVSGRLRRIAQHFANAPDCVVKAVVEVHKGIGRPEL